jgi:hypothetical protein
LLIDMPFMNGSVSWISSTSVGSSPSMRLLWQSVNSNGRHSLDSLVSAGFFGQHWVVRRLIAVLSANSEPIWSRFR